ncbi:MULTISPECIES: hypothetical protein [unclassified Cytobacillus]|uniref:hypothetical protein n=1 Tax=unclassified Cytobacillus TaxID=2675268 RepID=UPI0013571CDB|nr:hypothetical protein [Cytobacillus sp. AMY 15.2]KAF0818145.1 hypothetical protein KIS4809_2947 [Bacillus sp. ZZV12-4809]MCM3094340.1 hypothetical protein [Cytobacillus sp. AMY 15.2]
MKEIINGVSLLFLIQGVGGFINHLTNGGKSWFLVNYIGAFQGFEIVIDILLIVIGGIIALYSRKIPSSNTDK